MSTTDRRTRISVASSRISSDFDLPPCSTKPPIALAVGRWRARTRRALEQRFRSAHALTALADNADLTPPAGSGAETARDISSDFDAATLLAELVPHLPRDEAVIGRTASARRVDSDWTAAAPRSTRVRHRADIHGLRPRLPSA
jgi:hypothetical protein